MDIVDSAFPDVLENGVELVVESVGRGIVEICAH